MKGDLSYLITQAAKGLNINLTRAQEILDEWHHLYPKIEGWRKKLNEAIIDMMERKVGIKVDEDPVGAISRAKVIALRHLEHNVTWKEAVKSVDQLPEEAEDHDARYIDEKDHPDWPRIYIYSTEREKWETREEHLEAEEELKFVCHTCGFEWKPGHLADGIKCDDDHCRRCTGKECPSCEGNHVFRITWEPDLPGDEHPVWSVEDWKYEVAKDGTRQSYHAWVKSKTEEPVGEEKEG